MKPAKEGDAADEASGSDPEVFQSGRTDGTGASDFRRRKRGANVIIALSLIVLIILFSSVMLLQIGSQT